MGNSAVKPLLDVSPSSDVQLLESAGAGVSNHLRHPHQWNYLGQVEVEEPFEGSDGHWVLLGERHRKEESFTNSPNRAADDCRPDDANDCSHNESDEQQPGKPRLDEEVEPITNRQSEIAHELCESQETTCSQPLGCEPDHKEEEVDPTMRPKVDVAPDLHQLPETTSSKSGQHAELPHFGKHFHCKLCLVGDAGCQRVQIAVRPLQPEDVTLVAVHYRVEGGRMWNVDLHQPGPAGHWVHSGLETPGAPTAQPGNEVSYWIYAIRNGVGFQETGMFWQAC